VFRLIKSLSNTYLKYYGQTTDSMTSSIDNTSTSALTNSSKPAFRLLFYSTLCNLTTTVLACASQSRTSFAALRLFLATRIGGQLATVSSYPNSSWLATVLSYRRIAKTEGGETVYFMYNDKCLVECYPLRRLA